MFNHSEEYALASKFPHVRLMKISDVQSKTTLYDIKKYDLKWSLPSESRLNFVSHPQNSVVKC